MAKERSDVDRTILWFWGIAIIALALLGVLGEVVQWATGEIEMNALALVVPMFAVLFAQAMMGWSFVNIAIGIVLFLAICALVVAYCRWANVTIPPLLMTVVGIVLGAVIVIAAIIFLARFAGWA